MYEILRPKFPHIAEIIHQIPNTNVADIHKLDEKIALGASKGNKIDKAKKDLFKKLTAPVCAQLFTIFIRHNPNRVFVTFQLIGLNLCQLFRKEINIVNLPPMNLPPRNSHISVVDSGQSTGITKLFSTNS